MSYLAAAAVVDESTDQSDGHPPVDPEQRMHYAWRKLEKLTMDLATRNGSDLASLRDRIKDASDRSITILERAKNA